VTLKLLAPPVALSFTHGNAYAKSPPRRPEIEVELAATSPGGAMLGQPIRTNVLVDSGADFTMLDPQLGDKARCGAFADANTLRRGHRRTRTSVANKLAR
jgi:hypothetical protein